MAHSRDKKLAEQLKYDVRLTEYNLRNGLITQDELKKHLDSIPDSAGNLAPVTLEDRDDLTDTTH